MQLGREDLESWGRAKPANYFRALDHLPAVLTLRAPAPPSPSLLARLDAFGAAVAGVIEPAVQLQERSREFPRLRAFDEIGRPLQEIEFHPAHHEAAAAAWESGLLAAPLDAAGAFEVAALFVLLSHVGEGGQACPIVCTIGLRRALEHHARTAVTDTFLAGLTSTDAARALRGAQFLTEVQGGSDVGANEASASPDPDVAGAWRVSGEKWFCSVADADLFAVTARPDGAGPGTRGLACFVIPRTLEDGSPNGFRIRRLKDKLGTRLLASGEIDFDGARAWPIGPLDEGFHVAVTDLLNTSRWLNALGSAGIMSRTFMEASTFAAHRRAFGQPIEDFAPVREQLAVIKTEAAAAMASTFALTTFVARIDAGVATDADRAVHRFLVNANKYVTSIAASDVVHRGIEVLGGNGTIEDFSPLPRLYRDAVVFESWEGTHNVLCAQVHRDCRRHGLLGAVRAWVEDELARLTPAREANADVVRLALADVGPLLEASLADEETPVIFRHRLGHLVRVIQAACLLREADASSADPSRAAVAAFFIRRHLGGAARVEEQPGWLDAVDAALATAPPTTP